MGRSRWGTAGNDFNSLINGGEKLPGIRPPGGGLRQQPLQCGGLFLTGPFGGCDIPGSLLAVRIGSRLLPDGGGIVEWVKAEDLQRMEEESLVEPEIEAQPAEESFDIF